MPVILVALVYFAAINLNLYRADIARLQRSFNVNVERTVRELRGEQCLHWDDVRADKQQIYSTHSAGERITQQINLEQALTSHLAKALVKARKQQSLVKTVVLIAGNSPFDPKPYSKKYLVELAYPSSDTVKLAHLASSAAEHIFKDGIGFYKIGLGLLQLISQKQFQPDLFSAPSNDALMRVFDGLNQRYGRDTVFVGGQGVSTKWHMRQDRLTPRYSTRWSEIPKVQC